MTIFLIIIHKKIDIFSDQLRYIYLNGISQSFVNLFLRGNSLNKILRNLIVKNNNNNNNNTNNNNNIIFIFVGPNSDLTTDSTEQFRDSPQL